MPPAAGMPPAGQRGAAGVSLRASAKRARTRGARPPGPARPRDPWWLRGALAIVAAALGLGVPPGALGQPGPEASLVIVHGRCPAGGARAACPPLQATRYTLTCAPPGGILPDPAGACGRLAAVPGDPFAAAPAGALCTQIHGGPDRLKVTGVYRGQPVEADYSLVNGCEIARFRRMAQLLGLR
jgi:hypothetical protein